MDKPVESVGRTDHDMRTGRCQACRSAPVEVAVTVDDPDQPYLVCYACECRLNALALRPLEWFNLAALHGPWKFLLHDDFYDCAPEQRGEAYQARLPVEDPERFPIPTLEQVKDDRERLLDYAMTLHWFESNDGEMIAVALESHNKEAVLFSLQQRVAAAAPNPAIEAIAYGICARCLGEVAAPWIRERWEYHYREIVLISLANAIAACLPFVEGWERVTERLEAMDAKQTNDAIAALSYFRSTQTLDWMEAHRERSATDAWGRVAAVSGLTWERVLRWLDSGRPLSHVALAALQTIFPIYLRPIGIFPKPTPTLNDAPTVEEIIEALNAFALRDPVPNVRNRVGNIILALTEPIKENEGR